jgi:hypothetical protein
MKTNNLAEKKTVDQNEGENIVFLYILSILKYSSISSNSRLSLSPPKVRSTRSLSDRALGQGKSFTDPAETYRILTSNSGFCNY